jgi:myo-inositol-1(or 4)-monophosphatase
MNLKSTAVEAAQAAGRILRTHFEQGTVVRNKGPVDLVTDADIASERKIAEILRETFPDHSIMGEEEERGDPDAEFLWVIDPLDGTTNFAHGIPHFAVSIACLCRGQAEVGVIWNPMHEDLYVASRGQGAFHNGAAISVNAEEHLSHTLIGTGFYYDRGAVMQATLAAIGDCFRRNIHGIRRCGTASLDLASVAAGQYGAYFEYQLSAWDFAAGKLLVTEAGGHVSTCTGETLPLGRTSILASNGLLHESVLEIVTQHLLAG